MMNAPVLGNLDDLIRENCPHFVCVTSTSDIYLRHHIASEWIDAIPENGGITCLVASYKAR